MLYKIFNLLDVVYCVPDDMVNRSNPFLGICDIDIIEYRAIIKPTFLGTDIEYPIILRSVDFTNC